MRGGKRPGAGKKKGSKHKLTIGRELAAAQVIKGAEGQSPLEVMLEVMRDPNARPDVRLDAAKGAAPYVHRKQPQEVVVDQTMHLPPPILFVMGPPDGIPDDGPDPRTKPN